MGNYDQEEIRKQLNTYYRPPIIITYFTLVTLVHDFVVKCICKKRKKRSLCSLDTQR